MLRLTATLVAAILVVLSVWGRQSGADVEVTRAQPFEGGLVGAAGAATRPAPEAQDTDTAPDATAREISGDEAVRMALAAGEATAAASLLPSPDAAQAGGNSPDVGDAPLWYVVGDSVNLRAGPSTSDPVVGQASANDRAEVLSDPAGSWIRIRIPATGAEAWIFGRFLSETPA